MNLENTRFSRKYGTYTKPDVVQTKARLMAAVPLTADAFLADYYVLINSNNVVATLNNLTRETVKTIFRFQNYGANQAAIVGNVFTIENMTADVMNSIINKVSTGLKNTTMLMPADFAGVRVAGTCDLMYYLKTLRAMADRVNKPMYTDKTINVALHVDNTVQLDNGAQSKRLFPSIYVSNYTIPYGIVDKMPANMRNYSKTLPFATERFASVYYGGAKTWNTFSKWPTDMAPYWGNMVKVPGAKSVAIDYSSVNLTLDWDRYVNAINANGFVFEGGIQDYSGSDFYSYWNFLYAPYKCQLRGAPVSTNVYSAPLPLTARLYGSLACSAVCSSAETESSIPGYMNEFGMYKSIVSEKVSFDTPARDIASNIIGTPTFEIAGTVFSGQIPVDPYTAGHTAIGPSKIEWNCTTLRDSNIAVFKDSVPGNFTVDMVKLFSNAGTIELSTLDDEIHTFKDTLPSVVSHFKEHAVTEAYDLLIQARTVNQRRLDIDQFLLDYSSGAIDFTGYENYVVDEVIDPQFQSASPVLTYNKNVAAIQLRGNSYSAGRAGMFNATDDRSLKIKIIANDANNSIFRLALTTAKQISQTGIDAAIDIQVVPSENVIKFLRPIDGIVGPLGLTLPLDQPFELSLKMFADINQNRLCINGDVFYPDFPIFLNGLITDFNHAWIGPVQWSATSWELSGNLDYQFREPTAYLNDYGLPNFLVCPSGLIIDTVAILSAKVDNDLIIVDDTPNAISVQQALADDDEFMLKLQDHYYTLADRVTGIDITLAFQQALDEDATNIADIKSSIIQTFNAKSDELMSTVVSNAGIVSKYLDEKIIAAKEFKDTIAAKSKISALIDKIGAAASAAKSSGINLITEVVDSEVLYLADQPVNDWDKIADEQLMVCYVSNSGFDVANDAMAAIAAWAGYAGQKVVKAIGVTIGAIGYGLAVVGYAASKAVMSLYSNLVGDGTSYVSNKRADVSGLGVPICTTDVDISMIADSSLIRSDYWDNHHVFQTNLLYDVTEDFNRNDGVVYYGAFRLIFHPLSASSRLIRVSAYPTIISDDDDLLNDQIMGDKIQASVYALTRFIDFMRSNFTDLEAYTLVRPEVASVAQAIKRALTDMADPAFIEKVRRQSKAGIIAICAGAFAVLAGVAAFAFTGGLSTAAIAAGVGLIAGAVVGGAYLNSAAGQAAQQHAYDSIINGKITAQDLYVLANQLDFNPDGSLNIYYHGTTSDITIGGMLAAVAGKLMIIGVTGIINPATAEQGNLEKIMAWNSQLLVENNFFYISETLPVFRFSLLSEEQFKKRLTGYAVKVGAAVLLTVGAVFITRRCINTFRMRKLLSKASLTEEEEAWVNKKNRLARRVWFSDGSSSPADLFNPSDEDTVLAVQQRLG